MTPRGVQFRVVRRRLDGRAAKANHLHVYLFVVYLADVLSCREQLTDALLFGLFAVCVCFLSCVVRRVSNLSC